MICNMKRILLVLIVALTLIAEAAKSECPTCGGCRRIRNATKCSRCNGQGKLPDLQKRGIGGRPYVMRGGECPACKGKGMLVKELTCAECKGAGYLLTPDMESGSNKSSTLQSRSISSARKPLVKVKGVGLGENRASALKDAYRDAIERAVGLYVDAEQIVKNDQLIKDEILTHSNAYIEKSSILSCKQGASGVVRVEVLAEVRNLALTSRMKEVLPLGALNVKEASQSTHAQIVTEEKRDHDSSLLMHKSLAEFDPISGLINTSLVSPTPQRSLVDGAPDVVRLSYQVEFAVDTGRYQEFVGKLETMLRRISLSPPLSVRLSRDMELNQKVDASRQTRPTRPNTASVEASRTRRDHFSRGLRDSGVGQIEEYRDVYVVKGRIVNNEYIFSGLGSFWFSGFRRSSLSTPREDELRDIRYSFAEITRSHRARVLNGNLYVCLIDKVNGTGLGGKLYAVSASSMTSALDWQDSVADDGVFGEGSFEQGKPLNRISHYSISFRDKNGDEVIGTSLPIANQDILNCCCIQLLEPNDCLESEQARRPATYMWYVTPLVGGIARRYQKWFSVDVPKDDIVRINTVSIEKE